MAEATGAQLELANRYRKVATELYHQLDILDGLNRLNAYLATNWSETTLTGQPFGGSDVSNFIGTAGWYSNLLNNQDVSGAKGDHLGNLLKLAAPLG